MKLYFDQISEFIVHLPMWVPVLVIIIAFISVVGQWVLYSKCDQPGYACIVPVWNVIIFLKIVGRPANQSYYVIILPLLMLIPFILFLSGTISLLVAVLVASIFFLPWAWFLITIYKEVCQSFGKYNMTSYILIVVLNGLYLFNLALSQEEKYRGPVYKARVN